METSQQPILVIGSSGQLATSLAKAGRKDLVCVGRPDADLADAGKLAYLVKHLNPRIVLNAGGYTRVDPAESDAVSAFALNRDGPAALASLCAAAGIPLIHISTDCVFDGQKPTPYTPDDEPAPLSVYGHSKLAGELAVAARCSAHLIVRVSWVFSEHGENFVRTMLRLAGGSDEVSVVKDQYGYPTYCPDIAARLLQMTDRLSKPGFRDWGTFHIAGSEETDRASMAEAIFAESRSVSGPVAAVRKVMTADYPTPARRPLNARLDSATAKAVFGVCVPGWRSGLRRSVLEILRQAKSDSR